MKDILEDKESAENRLLSAESAENRLLSAALKDSKKRESLVSNMTTAFTWLTTETPMLGVPSLLVFLARLLMLSKGEEPAAHSPLDAVLALKQFVDGMAQEAHEQWSSETKIWN